MYRIPFMLHRVNEELRHLRPVLVDFPELLGHNKTSASCMGMGLILFPHTHIHTLSSLPCNLRALAFFSQGRPIIINFGKSSNEIRGSPGDLPPRPCLSTYIVFFHTGNKEHCTLPEEISLAQKGQALTTENPVGQAPRE